MWLHLRFWLLGLIDRHGKPCDVWKVDRDGRVYIPERKVVLRARAS